ncbi:MotA/TolQ/ExbB proton channel family protein [Candidatus Entotheonella palauensis]|nr:MotA/TolQ/ExbB proton channel family protein [Candidatus Entotheonella palauensis]
MKCAQCEADLVPGEMFCGQCGAPRSGFSRPMPPWVEEGLGQLPANARDDPPILALFIVSFIVTLLGWKWLVVPLLTISSGGETALWLGQWFSMSSEQVSEIIRSTQKIVFEHVINMASIAVSLWAVSFSVLRIAASARWLMSLRKAQNHLRRYRLQAPHPHAGELVTHWLSTPQRPQAANGVLKDLYEELAFLNADPATRFEERTERVTAASQRVSVMVRVAVWAIPIIGFVGTVLGISQAIASFGTLSAANVGASGTATLMAQFQTTMSDVMRGLGTAFNTTLTALALVLPVAVIVEAAGIMEEAMRIKGRNRFFREIWLMIAPSWRIDHDSALYANGSVASDEFSAEIRNLAEQLQALGIRLSSVHGLVGDLGSQVGRLHNLIRALEPVTEDTPDMVDEHSS